MYSRSLCKTLEDRLKEPRRFIQVIAGPRQVGKTTAVRQVLDVLNIPNHYVSADDPQVQSVAGIEQQWDIGRLRTKGEGGSTGAVLVLDEIQKIPKWSDLVKLNWDLDSAAGIPLKVVILGSSPLLVQQGLSESLAGRFEIIHATHWLFTEIRDAFGWDYERFIYYGGYPGAAPLADQPERWTRYITESLIETTIARDILHMTRVDKPSLLRRMFHLGCEYSGQILSYQKMIGQLQDAGNTTTLAHYLELLRGAGMVAGISKFSGNTIRQRGSSPKLQVLNNALHTLHSSLSFEETREKPDIWGRCVESAIGAHILNSVVGTSIEVFYWREKNQEVDFVLRNGRAVTAIEVKSGRRSGSLPGMDTFSKAFNPMRKILVGGQGLSLEEFFQTPLKQFV
jgi:hypothetical protein